MPALYQLKEEGKVRFIGVTGYPLQLLKSLIEVSDLDVSLSYCHYNLLNQQLAEVLIPLLKAKDMGIMNASVTHMGILTDQGAQAWHPAPELVKAAGRRAAAYCREQGLSLAELTTTFALHQPDIHVTVLGVRQRSELRGVLDLLAKPYPAEAIAKVQAILTKAHNINWKSGYPENDDEGAL
ncbi:MAG: aldo/keto reductase [Deinococcales bacterium]